jgi:hypothetical protein
MSDGMLLIILLGAIILLLILKNQSEKSTKTKLKNEWAGHHKSEILKSWGPPTGGIVSDGLGGEVLTYNQGTTSYKRQDPFGPTLVQETNYCHVYINKQKLIYDMKWTTS